MAIVTLHRPRKRNALTAGMWRELAQVARRIPQNPRTKVVIVRGAGNHFTAGSDISEFNRMSLEEVNRSFELMEEAISAFEQMPLPTIGVMKGYALGAGFILGLSMDLRVGGPGTVMGIPVGRLGITLSRDFLRRIVDLIGPSRTKDLVYTGRMFTAEECRQLGLVNYLVDDEEQVNQFALKLAKKISGQSPASLMAVKERIALSRSSAEMPWKSSWDAGFVDPHDFPEGVRAFVEKRKPNFLQRRRLDATARGN